MTAEEFVTACAGPLEAVYGAIDITTARMYRSFLQDLDPGLLSAAVAKCIGELKWLPKIAEIRQSAADIARGQVQEISPHEAWGQAQRAVAGIDFDIDGSVGRARQKVPPMVWEAMCNVGLTTLVNATRWQAHDVQRWFLDAYAALLARERKLLLAPPSVRREIESHRQTMQLPHTELVRNVAGRIGAEK